VPFWAKRFLGITLHPGQERLMQAYITRDKTRWRHAYLTIALSAGNRAGKTLALAVLILHSLFYKMGYRPPGDDDREVKRWLTARYEWYHFGIQQEVGELVYYEIARLHDGTHEAQKDGCPLTDELGPDWLTLDKKWRGEYRWVVINEVFGGAELHFRTTSERALGSLGKDMAGLSFDECGFEPNLTFIVNEVMHLRRLSTGGQLYLVSTPSEGFTQFSDEWKKGDPDDPQRSSTHYSLRMSTRDNVGFGIDEDIFDKLIEGMPDHLIPQNIDGHFIEGRSAFFDGTAVDEMFVDSLSESYESQPNHEYVQGVDPAIKNDGTWGIVLDITDRDSIVGVNVLRHKGKQKLTKLAENIKAQHDAYDTKHSECHTAIDSTGFGGSVFRDLLSDIKPLRAVEFGGTKAKKIRLLTDLKGFIEQGRLKFPRSGPWLDLRRQLLGYRLEDRKLETDAVMALAVAIRQVTLSPKGGRETIFDYFHEGTPEFKRERKLSPSWERLLSRGNGVKILGS